MDFIPYVEPIYGEFEYKLVTPLKVLGGLSVQIGKMGLIAADVEYVDYSNIRYRNEYDGYDITFINDYIEEDYKSVLNLKAGGEVRFGQLSREGRRGILSQSVCSAIKCLNSLIIQNLPVV